MSASAFIDHLPTRARCYRPRRYYLLVGVVYTVVFAAMGIVSMVVALWNVDGSIARPKLAALIVGTFWSGFTLLGVWIIVAYLRERLVIGEAVIVQRGICRTRALALPDVRQITWRARPVGGSVVVRTPSETATIYLHNFTLAEREELIRFFHEAFAAEIHENWSRFEEVVQRSSGPGKRASRGVKITVVALLMFHAVVFTYCWFVGLGTQYLIVGAVNAAGAVVIAGRAR